MRSTLSVGNDNNLRDTPIFNTMVYYYKSNLSLYCTIIYTPYTIALVHIIDLN